jgi:hypothetical protein
MNPLILLAIPAFAGLDRLWGGDTRWHGRSGHSLGTIGAILLAGVMLPIAGPFAAFTCVLWALYRSLNNSGGAFAPVGIQQDINAFGRHLIVAFAMVAVLAVRQQISTISAFDFHLVKFEWRMLVYFIYAASAGVLAVVNGMTQGRSNWFVETGRGAVFGMGFVGVWA